MNGQLRVLNRPLLEVLGGQPNVGFAVFKRAGEVLFCNPAARRLYYGVDDFDPVGQTVNAIEGDEFSAELMPIIEKACASQLPISIEHVRFGRRIASVGWPIRSSLDVPEDHADALLVMTTLARTESAPQGDVEPLQSSIASWGVLERLTDRELEVLAEIGRGLSQQAIAEELGITRKTVETHRSRIGQKLNAKSSNELARIACESGLRRSDVQLRRQSDQQWMELAETVLKPRAKSPDET